MNQISLLWEIFVNILEGCLFLYLLMHQFQHNRKTYPYVISGIVLRIVWITVLNFKVSDATLTLILLLFYDILYTNLIFKGSNGTKMLWGCSYIVIALIADKMTFWIANQFTDYELKELITTGNIRIIMSMVYLLICFVLVLFLSHWRKKDIFLPLRFRIMLTALICLGIIASDQLLNVIIYMDITGNHSEFISHLELISYIILFIVLGFIIFIEYLGIVTKQNENLKQAAALNDLNREHFKTISTTISAIKDWKHDYKIHLQILLNLAKEGKNQELVEFVSNLETDMINTAPLVSTNNQILDALLSTKLLESRKYSIKFTYEIYLVKELPFDNIIFASLIGNLINNAIEACCSMKTANTKYIDFHIKPFHEMIHIKIENSTDNQYTYNTDGTIKTTKTGAGHGIGLKRVQEIVSSVEGFCNIYPHTDKFSVIIMIPLPNQPQGKYNEYKDWNN